MTRKILLYLLIFCSFNSFACLNGETKELKNGFLLYEDFEGGVPRGHNFFFEKGELEWELKALDSIYQTIKDLDYLSDKGIVLILLGDYKSAIDLYLEIEKLEPNRYSTASNIGTAYELIGQTENALNWIKKAVKIDSASHNNSEWVHVRILEAKIKGENYYTSNNLIDTDFGLEDEPISQLTRKELEKLHAALFFQLNERISFIKGEDKIIAQLFFDLGNISFLLHRYSEAEEDYKIAQTYGFENQLATIRISESENQVVGPVGSLWKNKFLRLAVGLVLLVAIIVFIRYIISRTING